ncbi:hypothetical protein BDZ45DRAFT_749614 [Acephala macrosclerotiorum]|nr:hypothetical protein BDZ45DRAFT_749614 [Acephala macrosclerotiorum]
MAFIHGNTDWLAQTYIFERTFCITSGYPVAISDEHIKVNLPFESEHNHTSPNSIHAVQFFGHQLPDSVLDYNQWVEATDKEIENSQDHALSSHKAAPDWFTNAYGQQLLGAKTDYLIFPFHTIYNGFHSGIVLLYAVKHRAETYHSWELYGQVVEALALLTLVFSALAERSPPAINTEYYFNEPKEGVLRNIELASEPGDSLGDVNLLAELEHLVTDRQTSGNYHRNTASIYTQPADNYNQPELDAHTIIPIRHRRNLRRFYECGIRTRKL